MKRSGGFDSDMVADAFLRVVLGYQSWRNPPLNRPSSALGFTKAEAEGG